MEKRTTILDFQKQCDRGEKLAVVTAYDYSMALAVDAAGVDAILVGDSLSMTMLGRPNTLSATMDEMIHHTKAVVKGVKNALVIGDLPFLSYQLGLEEALDNAGAFLAEAGAQAVKLEWCPQAPEVTAFLVENGIPVMGHVGFTPQHVNQMGGYHQQGKDKATATQLLQQAKSLEKAGAFSVVLELVPAEVAKKITGSLRIPTIGIGAGPHCDGQVQVLHDLLGLLPDFHPKHAKAYLKLHEAIREAVLQYKQEVKTGKFPQ
ncbi:MAG TPA: 3-methyl-2-oxobutanoate hydroxymethyltransferase [bacterium]|jgi:3-methyl-2-oxobutanoate hydroxymethyltransferase|nr:3-methyl-2-oxobutanoate hydroxymethyltransferase [bacterium]